MDGYNICLSHKTGDSKKFYLIVDIVVFLDGNKIITTYYNTTGRHASEDIIWLKRP